MSSKQYKKGIDLDEGRRRREATAVAIRKDKKEENILKRRNITMSETINTTIDLSNLIEQPANKNKKYSIKDIPELLVGLQTNDQSTQLDCIRGFRRLLSTESIEPIEECIRMGAIPLFVEYLKRYDNNDLQYEAAWALTNVASTKYTSIVVSSNAIPQLVQLLASPIAEIREQSAWCLGNISGDNPTFRDAILQQNGLLPLLTNIMQPASISLLRNCTWTLSNFCRGKPSPLITSIAPALPILSQIILTCEDFETIVDAIWALSYISDGDDKRVQLVVDLGITSKLVSFLTTDKSQIIVPSLRVLGNMTSGNDTQTEEVIKANILPNIIPCITNNKRNIRKESLWLLSNIAAGTANQIERLLQTPNLLSIIIDQINENNPWEVRKEGIWTICNSIMNCSHKYIMKIIELNGINELIKLLDLTIDVKIIILVLDSIERILKLNTQFNFINNIYDLFDNNNGIDKLETLQTHENETIYQKSCHIIEAYFNNEENDENDSNQINNHVFTFGINNNDTNNKVFSFNNTNSNINVNMFNNI